MPIESEKKIAGGKEVRFAATPPMSSYLNVFVAGELDLIESRSGPTQIRVIATKGKAEMGRYALEATAQILQYYNDYFGVAVSIAETGSDRAARRLRGRNGELGRHHLLRIEASV